MAKRQKSVTVNGRTYAWPKRPVVVICVDGCAPDYISCAVAAGQMPYLATIRSDETMCQVDTVIPSFTNPNNVSIVTGVPPAAHGICGNYFYDAERDVEVMMNEPEFLRAPTILAAFSEAGAKVAVVTAKDKLRRLLGFGMQGICFSSEKADQTTGAEHGIDDALEFVGLPLPSVYSAAASEFVFAAGVRLLERERPDLTYLSTTDYIQHKYAPGTTAANSFYHRIDTYLERLDALGAVFAVTADHGMNAKTDADGSPNVIYLQDVLDLWLGADMARVVLPVTDPYVVHHGSLGAFATVYLAQDVDVQCLVKRLKALDGMAQVLVRAEACRRFELPADRTGDIVAISGREWVIGTSPDRHDLSGLTMPLRSHGGLYSQRVPLILNRAVLNLHEGERLRNYDTFHVALDRT
jgi:phosphonoacetate hydrolase